MRNTVRERVAGGMKAGPNEPFVSKCPPPSTTVTPKQKGTAHSRYTRCVTCVFPQTAKPTGIPRKDKLPVNRKPNVPRHEKYSERESGRRNEGRPERTFCFEMPTTLHYRDPGNSAEKHRSVNNERGF
ncbi:hypothetical protein CDAR_541201 [Caerostris darwini]|uniref:Uncharacterized protein n=1 Tax=Caerostris darwini TaxID=1538125 RepID=A0AAV4WBV4_9ARAC|nr:hypothetical protein CDAR_541201 [Caerostris darwini]